MAELNSQPMSIQSIYSLYREGKLIVNRRYQRKLVWTLEEKQKLIESILCKYPIPAILIAEAEDKKGQYEIIDGLQRLHAIMSYIEMAFKSIDGKFFNLDYFTTAKTYQEEGFFKVDDYSKEQQQDSKQVSAILDYSMPMSIMRNATEDQVNDVFDRINTYGHRLSDQERRQAGVKSPFTDLVRDIACKLRGDVSDVILDLTRMPEVSIDLPLNRHGYGVSADEVFWVRQGVLRSVDLRDSMDEQCIADITACIVGNKIIKRSKDALDNIYSKGNSELLRIEDGLEVYGAEALSDEFAFCIDEIQSVVGDSKLKDLIYKKRSSNPFPATFAVIFLAFHDLLIKSSKKISDYQGVKTAMHHMSERIKTTKDAGSPDERDKNIRAIKALIDPYFVDTKDLKHVYGQHSTIDVDAIIRRSGAELADYELKQGMVTLSPQKRKIDEKSIKKIINTICAIANNGPNKTGKLLIGVADTEQDAKTVEKIDGITSLKVGKKHVVGVKREAKALGKTVEEYLALWKARISDSELSEALKTSVLSNLDYHDYFGLGLIIITIPPQRAESYVGEAVYWRDVDSTKEVEGFKQHGIICARFK
ncbi:GmrSD restriction endonuclease domain-containing protein [Vibrio celticus]|uniref:GmrSD restriction endonuclease domain-containing protein n=1 Tax=Vibrio celticus TaxID=446372 RepID=UPI0040677C20